MITPPSLHLGTGWAALDRTVAQFTAQCQTVERALANLPLAKQRRAHQAKTAANQAALIIARRSLRQVTAETCTPSAPRNLTATTPELVLRLHQGNAPNTRQHRAHTREATPN